jgi:hypothetical protein
MPLEVVATGAEPVAVEPLPALVEVADGALEASFPLSVV